jgi:hypothetical protein
VIEAAVESYFKRRVRETGGEERKVVFPGRKGAPDRLCGWPNGRHAFVELKRPKGKAEKHQEREHRRLASIGFDVWLIDTREMVDAFIATYSHL